jgi:putative transposase
MARPLRIEYPNAFYHVMNRGLSRREIYLGDDDYEIFLGVLKETSKLFDIRVLAYAFMPNHYHLLIQTPKANLSRAMRHLNGVYTQRFNRFHNNDGPLFRGRYKAILIQEE